MSASTPYNEPAALVAGDTAKWLKALADYPASAGWVLTYALVNATQRITFDASASGDEHLVTVAASTTAAWVAGRYSYRAQVALAGEVYTVASGDIVVRPAFASAQDARSAARRTLDAIEATIEGRASVDAEQLTIAGRSVKYLPVAELLTLRDRYRMEVAREEAAQRAALGLLPAGRVQVRFAR